MAYDDLKVDGLAPYTGMRVGASHTWTYQPGRWTETKTSKDAWSVLYQSRKTRASKAPDGSGAAVGSQYHWLVVGHQYVRKVDANAYDTFLVGAKWKVAHKRPYWSKWSDEYPGQEPAAQATARVLYDQAVMGLPDLAPGLEVRPADGWPSPVWSQDLPAPVMETEV